MSDNFVDVLPVFILFPCIVLMLRDIWAYMTRKRLIDKGLVGDEARKLFQTGIEGYVPSSLKWGLILVLIGIVLVVIDSIPGYVSSEVKFGAVLISAGAGLLIYYYLASAKFKQMQNK